MRDTSEPVHVCVHQKLCMYVYILTIKELLHILPLRFKSYV